MTAWTMSRQMTNRRRGRQRGTSLIEVVVAMGVFALIASVLSGALWAGRGQLARFESPGEDRGQLLAVRRVLTGLIESATVAGSGPEPGATVFAGTGDRALFNATSSDRGQTGALYQIELAIEHDTSDGDLTSRLVLKRKAMRGDGEGEISEVIRRPGHLVFRYTANPGPYSSKATPDWTETWPDPDRLPARIQLADPDGPILTIAVRQSKDPRCILRRGVQMLTGGQCLVR
jgi:Prokaryotic N-terminal methylation motif